MNTYKFNIKNLDCANGANQLEKSLQTINIIKNVRISFITQKLIFECLKENKKLALEQIKKIIKKEEPDITIEEV